jgi:hypothetical protein
VCGRHGRRGTRQYGAAHLVGVEDPEGELQRVVALLRLDKSGRPLPPHAEGIGVQRGVQRGAGVRGQMGNANGQVGRGREGGRERRAAGAGAAAGGYGGVGGSRRGCSHQPPRTGKLLK